jgi:hypothetical protein
MPVHRIRLHGLPSDRGLPQVDRPRGHGQGPGAGGLLGDSIWGSRGRPVRWSASGRVPADLPKQEQEAPHLDGQNGPRDRLGDEMRPGKGNDENADENDQDVQDRYSGHPPDRGRPPDDPGQVTDVLPELVSC